MKERGELNPQRNTSSEKYSSEKPPLHFLPAPLLRPFPLVYALIVIYLLGCGDKSIRKNEIRTITSEIVAAAQKTTQRKSEIAIRPEAQSADAGANRASADDVYITLSDASQADGLRQALDEIAHRHTLSVSETNSSSIQRLDFFFQRDTHPHGSCRYASSGTSSCARIPEWHQVQSQTRDHPRRHGL